jgi:hypothetical protein
MRQVPQKAFKRTEDLKEMYGTVLAPMRKACQVAIDCMVQLVYNTTIGDLPRDRKNIT